MDASRHVEFIIKGRTSTGVQQVQFFKNLRCLGQEGEKPKKRAFGRIGNMGLPVNAVQEISAM